MVRAVIQQKNFTTLKQGPIKSKNAMKKIMKNNKKLVCAHPNILFKSLYWSSFIK